MDTKRNPSIDGMEKKAAHLVDSILYVDPDMLVVSDEIAIKYIVEPNLSVLNTPVVFCGVNRTDRDYNLPKERVTGILEILPVADAMKTMKSLKQPLSSFMNFCLIIGLTAILNFSCSTSPDIAVQNMNMKLSPGQQSFREELLPGEIADTKIEHIAYVGPTIQWHELSEDSVDMFLFIKGSGKLKADTLYFSVVPESIAIPFVYKNIGVEVSEGDTLHFVQFTKKMSARDKEDFKTFPIKNRYDIYFTKFIDCEPYTEKIKSPNTVSRTVLPADIIPRVSLGTVEAPGPDEVGAHEHPMLDQLFLGLTNNDITVHAGKKSAKLKEYSLLHIPIGSSHWVTVEKNKKMYYMWMDFFLTKEGQEWLKTHKPVSTDKDDY